MLAKLFIETAKSQKILNISGLNLFVQYVHGYRYQRGSVIKVYSTEPLFASTSDVYGN